MTGLTEFCAKVEWSQKVFKGTVSQSGYSNTILCVAGIELKSEERENWEREWTWYQVRGTPPTLD